MLELKNNLRLGIKNERYKMERREDPTINRDV